MPTPAKFKPNSTYTVIGDCGGIGRALIKWLAENGAKQILSVSRSGSFTYRCVHDSHNNGGERRYHPQVRPRTTRGPTIE